MRTSRAADDWIVLFNPCTARYDIGYNPAAVCRKTGTPYPLNSRTVGDESGGCRMTTTNALDDMFDDAERGLEWLEKLEALQSRSASDQAAYEVAEYVMKLRTAVTELAGNRTVTELTETVGADTAHLVDELRVAGENDYWNTRIRPALLKTDL